jgi:hypothetical protein
MPSSGIGRLGQVLSSDQATANDDNNPADVVAHKNMCATPLACVFLESHFALLVPSYLLSPSVYLILRALSPIKAYDRNLHNHISFPRCFIASGRSEKPSAAGQVANGKTSLRVPPLARSSNG